MNQLLIFSLAVHPILETLELIYCRNLPQRLNLSKSLSLRRLEIKWSFKSSYPVEIVAPHIHYLKLTMYEESCTLVDVSSVTQASLEIFFNNNFFWVAEFVQIMVLKMLEKLQNIERLTLGRTLLQVYYICLFHSCILQLRAKLFLFDD